MNNVCLPAKLSQNSHQGYSAKNGGSYPCLEEISPEIVLGWPEYRYDSVVDPVVARYYDATIGRFISPDSIVPQPYNPQSLNRYSYCLNNPLRYIDPSGHLALPYPETVEEYGLDADDIYPVPDDPAAGIVEDFDPCATGVHPGCDYGEVIPTKGTVQGIVIEGDLAFIGQITGEAGYAWDSNGDGDMVISLGGGVILDAEASIGPKYYHIEADNLDELEEGLCVTEGVSIGLWFCSVEYEQIYDSTGENYIGYAYGLDFGPNFVPGTVYRQWSETKTGNPVTNWWNDAMESLGGWMGDMIPRPGRPIG